MRREIETRLDALIPPLSPETQHALQDIGVMVAPLLIKKLGESHGADASSILYVLDGIDFDPAIPAIAQHTSDPSPADFIVQDGFQLSIGEFSIFILGRKEPRSETAARAFAVAMLEPQSLRFLEFLSSIAFFGDPTRKIITDVLEAARQGTPAPKPAKSTPQQPPNNPTPDQTSSRNARARTEAPSPVRPSGKAPRNASRPSTLA